MLTIVLRHTGADTKDQTFSVNLGDNFNLEGMRTEILAIANGARFVGYRATRQGGTHSGVLCAIYLTVVFDSHYETAFVAIKELVAKVQQKVVDAETARKAGGSAARKSFMLMSG